MNLAEKRKLTSEGYLAIEREAEFKSEFVDGEMFAMAGLRSMLKGKSCRVYNSDMRTKIQETGLYTYPDVQYECHPH